MTRGEIAREIRENLVAWNRHDAAGTVVMRAEHCALQVEAGRHLAAHRPHRGRGRRLGSRVCV